MSEIIFKNQKEWRNAMFHAAGLKTVYINHFPQNCLFKTADIISADCSNFQKCLFNGADIYNLVPGANKGRLWPNNTGDCTCEQLIEQCSDKSADFAELLKKKQPMLLYLPGHIGAYIGEAVKVGNFYYNVVEWTAWDGDFSAGCIFSWIDKNGRRIAHKGSTNQCLSWTKYGKPSKWVKYVEDGKLVIDGVWDRETTKALQIFLGCSCKDGLIRGQLAKYRSFVPAITDQTAIFGNRTDATSIMVVRLQRFLKMKEKHCNGKLTKGTCKALNQFLGIKNKDIIDTKTVKALQKYLNENA